MHDPADLVPSTAADPFALLHYWADERSVQGRDDVLTFTGEPFAEPLDLAGPVDVASPSARPARACRCTSSSAMSSRTDRPACSCAGIAGRRRRTTGARSNYA